MFETTAITFYLLVGMLFGFGMTIGCKFANTASEYFVHSMNSITKVIRKETQHV